MAFVQISPPHPAQDRQAMDHVWPIRNLQGGSSARIIQVGSLNHNMATDCLKMCVGLLEDVELFRLQSIAN